MAYSGTRALRRHALLIGAPGNDPPLVGVAADLQNYQAFLQSDCGGAWEEGEIEVLQSPPYLQVGIAIELTRDIDFGLVIFVGHGHCDQNGTNVWLNHKEYCPVFMLNTYAGRQVTIVDACRTRLEEPLLEKHASFGAEVGGWPDVAYRASCRRLYNAAILRAEKGPPSVVFGCSENEAAGETRLGGVFSHTLLSLARDWSTEAQNGGTASNILDIPSAFLAASRIMVQRRIHQNPFLENGRRWNSFPFAIA